MKTNLNELTKDPVATSKRLYLQEIYECCKDAYEIESADIRNMIMTAVEETSHFNHLMKGDSDNFFNTIIMLVNNLRESFNEKKELYKQQEASTYEVANCAQRSYTNNKKLAHMK